MFGIGILMVWVICKIFAWPLKILFKLVINAVMGAIVLLVINIIGSAVGFTLPITALTALLVGLLGVPGVFIVCRSTAYAVFVLFLPVFHEYANNVVSLLFKQQRRHGGIHSAGHAEDYLA